jgi:hypothetical protein
VGTREKRVIVASANLDANGSNAYNGYHVSTPQLCGKHCSYTQCHAGTPAKLRLGQPGLELRLRGPRPRSRGRPYAHPSIIMASVRTWRTSVRHRQLSISTLRSGTCSPSWGHLKTDTKRLVFFPFNSLGSGSTQHETHGHLRVPLCCYRLGGRARRSRDAAAAPVPRRGFAVQPFRKRGHGNLLLEDVLVQCLPGHTVLVRTDDRRMLFFFFPLRAYMLGWKLTSVSGSSAQSVSQALRPADRNRTV